MRVNAFRSVDERRSRRLVAKYNAKGGIDTIRIVQGIILRDLVDAVIPEEKPEPEEIKEEEEETDDKDNLESSPTKEADTKAKEEEKEEEEDKPEKAYDPIDAAVRSIMGPEGTFGDDEEVESPTKTEAPPSGSQQQQPQVPPPQQIQQHMPPQQQYQQQQRQQQPSSVGAEDFDEFEPPQLVSSAIASRIPSQLNEHFPFFRWFALVDLGRCHQELLHRALGQS